MNIWKSETIRPHSVWVSEIRLRTADATRKGKVNKLLKLLKESVKEVKDAPVS